MTDIRWDRILIVRLSAIGDVINALPALAILRQNFPKSYIAWVVQDRAKDAVVNHPDLDEVFVFRRREWKPSLFDLKSILKASRTVPDFIRNIRRKHFTVALDFQGNLKSGVITYLSNAPQRIGFAAPAIREFNTLFTTTRISLPKQCIHRRERGIYLLKTLGLKTDSYQVKFPISPADETYIEDFLSRLCIPHSAHNIRLVVFHPSTSRFGAYKRWGLNNYAELGNVLINKYGVNLVITWGADERPMAEEVARLMRPKPIIDLETSTLGRLAALLKRTDLFIGSDSAPLQLASILERPVVALFGPKNPLIYGPTHEKSIVIRKELACSPCHKRTCPKPDCMNLITVEEVFSAASKLLG